MRASKVEEYFKALKLDADTRLTQPRRYQELRGYRVALERWSWEGVIGRSVVFRSDEIGALNDEELKELVRSTFNVEGPMTIKRTRSYILVNHSFC